MSTRSHHGLYGFGLGPAWPCNDEQPQRIAGKPLGGDGRDRSSSCVQVVFVAKPGTKDPVNVRKASLRRRPRCFGCRCRGLCFLPVTQIFVRLGHAGVEAGSQRGLDGLDALVGDVAVYVHGAEQRALDRSTIEPPARHHAAESESERVERSRCDRRVQ